MISFIDTDHSALTEMLRDFPADKAVVMLNLLKFAQQANYAPIAEVEPCSGFEAFARYGSAVAPMIAACGGELVWQGQQAAMLIGPQDKNWDLTVLVRYPSASAFLGMIGSPEYQAIAFHRSAALADSRLIAHEEL